MFSPIDLTAVDHIARKNLSNRPSLSYLLTELADYWDTMTDRQQMWYQACELDVSPTEYPIFLKKFDQFKPDINNIERACFGRIISKGDTGRRQEFLEMVLLKMADITPSNFIEPINTQEEYERDYDFVMKKWTAFDPSNIASIMRYYQDNLHAWAPMKTFQIQASVRVFQASGAKLTDVCRFMPAAGAVFGHTGLSAPQEPTDDDFDWLIPLSFWQHWGVFRPQDLYVNPSFQTVGRGFSEIYGRTLQMRELTTP